ncbi:MAG: ISAzo13 family transposase, partial [Dehalococcoidia bacterium]
LPLLNEAQARLYVAQKALEMGRGGISRLAKITGMSRPTITKGIRELEEGIDLQRASSVRKKGGGRKKVEATDLALLCDLEMIMEENTAGDPMSYLKWTGKSVRKISEELAKMHHRANPNTVCRLLREMGFSLRANVKWDEGKQHPDRDAQFGYINEQTKALMTAGDPVISVDTKKKELVGNFKNQGRTWRRQDKVVKVYDFPSQAEGKAIAYGIYDVQQNMGMVNVGITHDTAEFAVESITKWWKAVGSWCYPKSKRLLICADSGGSNGSRTRLWKVALQEFADTFGLEVRVLHYPPGTSKWNKIEHRMFSFISINWKGEPLVSYETVINLISTTSTKSGLKISAQLDRKNYETGIKVSDKQMKALRIQRHEKHPDWNYTLSPRTPVEQP